MHNWAVTNIINGKNYLNRIRGFGFSDLQNEELGPHLFRKMKTGFRKKKKAYGVCHTCSSEEGQGEGLSNFYYFSSGIVATSKTIISLLRRIVALHSNTHGIFTASWHHQITAYRRAGVSPTKLGPNY